MNDSLVVISCLLVVIGGCWLGWRIGKNKAGFSIHFLPPFTGIFVVAYVSYPSNLMLLVTWFIFVGIAWYLADKHEKRKFKKLLRQSPTVRKFMEDLEKEI